jgi:hypothetical protein
LEAEDVICLLTDLMNVATEEEVVLIVFRIVFGAKTVATVELVKEIVFDMVLLRVRTVLSATEMIFPMDLENKAEEETEAEIDCNFTLIALTLTLEASDRVIDLLTAFLNVAKLDSEIAMLLLMARANEAIEDSATEMSFPTDLTKVATEETEAVIALIACLPAVKVNTDEAAIEIDLIVCFVIANVTVEETEALIDLSACLNEATVPDVKDIVFVIALEKVATVEEVAAIV